MPDSLAANTEAHRPLLSRITTAFVYLFERLLPASFVFAILLSLVTAALALALAPHGLVQEVVGA